MERQRRTRLLVGFVLVITSAPFCEQVGQGILGFWSTLAAIAMRIFRLIDTRIEGLEKILADGCVLPDGQVAIAWLGKHKTHGCYRNFQSFEEFQLKIPGRAIEDSEPSHTEFCFGVHTYSFRLVRTEDVTEVSGTGIVAEGCDFFDRGCILQWLVEPFGTFWYPGIKTIEELHGHGGKTRIEIDKPENLD